MTAGGESRGGKKIRWPKGRAGSSPAPGTIIFFTSLRADGVRNVEDDAPRAVVTLPDSHVVPLLCGLLVRGLRPQLVCAVGVAEVAGARNVRLRRFPRQDIGLCFESLAGRLAADEGKAVLTVEPERVVGVREERGG